MLKMTHTNKFIFILLLTVAASVASTSGDNSTDDGGNFLESNGELQEALRGLENIENTVHKVLLQLRNKSAIKVPGFDIPDPMPIEDFDTYHEDSFSTVDIQMWNVTIEGLSEFIVNHVMAHLTNMHVNIGMNFTTLTTKGQYNLLGKALFLRLKGNGDFWMKIKGSYVSGTININVTEDGSLVVEHVFLDIVIEDIQLHFENLGRGMNSMINVLSNVIFKTLKPTILEEIQNTVKMQLNDEFSNSPPEPLLGRAISPLDIALANAATQIRNNKLDPMQMPNFQKSINRRVLFMNVHGNLSLYNGYLKGLSSIHRTGDIMINYKENNVEVSAEIGFWTLQGGYKWHATLMGITRRGGVHFFVNGVNLLFNATQANVKGAYPQLTALQIMGIKQVGIDVDGLGSFDFLLEFFVNFFTNVFKKQFSRITEAQLKGRIQKELQQIKVPF